ncbi:MAG TPA: serine proteinase inhibitor [Clostridiales bacterium]|nr:serine proteinase inhibitor [Clostridiales bacterium]
MTLKLTTILSLLLVILLAFSGCAVKPAADLMAGVKAAEWPSDPDEPGQSYIASQQKFAWDLLQESLPNPGNILLSPASVYLALAMTLNGSDTTTRQAMLEALSAAGLTLDDINKASRDWTTLLTSQDDKTKLTIANSIWYRDGFNPDQDFLQRNADYFAAAARMLDFSKPEAVDTINSWVSQATSGRIDRMLEEIGPAVVMYLINTIHFKADWQAPFIKNYTAEGNFTAPDGISKAQFMHQTGKMTYLEFKDATGVLLPYADDRFAFFAILPPEDTAPRQLALGNDSSFLNEILASASEKDIELALPAFKTNYSDSLVNELKNLGMDVAFGNGADFSLMNSSRSKDLFISEVKHKTMIDLNENGTEAAAATLVEISKQGLPQADIILTFDRPFLYGIVDRVTGAPIFIGILEQVKGEG